MANAFAAPYFKNDLEVLNYALTLEHLENVAYRTINASGKLTGKNVAYFRVIGKHEQDHVDALTAAISKAGGTPVKERKSYDFSKIGPLNTEAEILKVAQAMEELGVKAYNGAGTEITDKGILGVAGQIVQVEARHTGLLRALNNVSPADAFPPMMKPADVIAFVTPILGPEQ